MSRAHMHKSAVITQDVQNENSSIGAPAVEFICRVSGASSCNWIVNEKFSANDRTVISKFKITNTLLKDDAADANENADITCIMTVPTTPVDLINGTRVQCLPLVALGEFAFEKLEGSTAKMLLQGVLVEMYDVIVGIYVYQNHAVALTTILCDISLFTIYMVKMVQRVFFKIVIV